jgi:tRNA (pseudouridine54-N1)-methyltransferase
LDILLRCVRASLLVSHGLRQDVILYLVLLGGENAPVTIRFTGGDLRHLNPDERTTASLVQHALSTSTTGPVWQPASPGVDVAAAGLEDLRSEFEGSVLYMLDGIGQDVRDTDVPPRHATFFLGDHLGFTKDERALLEDWGVLKLSVGPVILQADDVITLIHNEWDRRKL